MNEPAKIDKNNRMNDKTRTKDMTRKGLWVLLCAAMLLPVACSTVYEDETAYNDIEIPFKDDFRTDTVTYGKLPVEHARHILNLADPSSEIVGKADYTFRTDELISVRQTAEDDSLRITSWSAKTIYDVTLEMYIPEVGEYLPVAYFDSIPGFSRFTFKPSFVGRRNVCRTVDGGFVSFECPHLDMEHMMVRLKSDDEHFKKLQKIDAKWTCSFSNYSWTPTAGDNCPYRELRPIYAREWVVIVTNYAYMMTTPEYDYVLSHFSDVMGGDLCDNDKNLFDADKYQTEKARFKAEKTFNFGTEQPGLRRTGRWIYLDGDGLELLRALRLIQRMGGHRPRVHALHGIFAQQQHDLRCEQRGRRERGLDGVHLAAAHVAEPQGRPALYRPQPLGLSQAGERTLP